MRQVAKGVLSSWFFEVSSDPRNKLTSKSGGLLLRLTRLKANSGHSQALSRHLRPRTLEVVSEIVGPVDISLH